MKDPGFQISSVRVLGVILGFALAGSLRADPPSGPAPQSMVPAPRTQPQIIYRVRPTSDYADKLRSQDKNRNNELPIDSSMPTSLQLSRANANAEARAQAEAAARADEQEQSAASEPRRKRPKMQRSQGQRPQFSVKQKGPRHGHGGGKGHKGH
jgi:hypothetical protein